MSQSANTRPLCPGYVSDGPRGAPLRVKFRNGRLIEAVSADEKVVGPQLYQAVGGWTLMAVITHEGLPAAVFEELGAQQGHVAFVGGTGLLRRVAKSLEPSSEGEAGLGYVGASAWYRGHRKEDALPDHRDVQREELLAGEEDPRLDDVAACYPPVRHAFFEGHLRPHTFVGTGISSDVVPLYYRDVAMVSRVPIGVVAPGSERAMESGDLWEGLLGDWVPIVRNVYPVAQDESWEAIVFASSATANSIKQPVWYRFVRMRGGRPLDVKYIDSFLPHPHPGKRLAERFYEELLLTLEYWDRETAGGMTVIGWDWVRDRSRHAFAREMITRRGAHPKYGIADQAYAGAEHDGFQDVLVSSVLGCLEWGYFDRARAYLDDYFMNFVRADGTLHCRGPEMGKYGVSLTCLGLYFDYTRDGSLLDAHREKIDAIADMLVGRWRKARERSPGGAAYGMIAGYHEADINFLTPNVHELDYDRPYLSNTGVAWRGLRDLGSAFETLGHERGDEAMVLRGQELSEVAGAVFTDARSGVERSWITKDGVTGLPIIAGDSTFYWEHPYRARPESYDENRVWSELYYGGTASKETVRRIWDIAGERGHTTLGIFNNRKSLVGFLVWEEIAGLLQYDMVREALLAFYAHACHAHTRGTWTAIECVDMDRARGAHSPYCLPAQMTLPIVAKWLLVHEDPVSGRITLAHGLPRERLEHGREIGVADAPTRWGKLGYRLASRIDDGEIAATVTMPERPGADVRLRLRAPVGFSLVSGRATNRSDAEVSVDGDCVVLPRNVAGEVEILTGWERA